MYVQCMKCHVHHLWLEDAQVLRKRSTVFRRLQKRFCKPASLFWLPTTLKELINSNTFLRQEVHRSIQAYYFFLPIGFVKVECAFRDPGTPTFNPAMTIHGRPYHYLGAVVLPSFYLPFYLFTYMIQTIWGRTIIGQELSPISNLRFHKSRPPCFMNGALICNLAWVSTGWRL